MHLVVDGYNLLHVNRSLTQLNSVELRWERDRLVDRLSVYRQLRPCEITIVFDGWQGGWNAEMRERKRGVEIIFSRIGERADEVIKRLIREKGAGVVVITSDREISRYADKLAVAVVPSNQFMEKVERAVADETHFGKVIVEEEKVSKGKGPSRRLSKREKRLRATMKRL